MTIDELRAQLDELGIEYPSKAKKADLEALLPAQLEESSSQEDAAADVEEVEVYDGRVVLRKSEVRVGERVFTDYVFTDGTTTRA